MFARGDPLRRGYLTVYTFSIDIACVPTEVGQILLEKHELYIDQSQQTIQELRDRCHHSDTQLTLLHRENNRLKRAVEASDRDRETAEESRTQLEKVSG